MAVIDGKYLSIEGLSHLWAELKQKFATAAQGTKADTAVQTIKIGNTEQTKTNGVVTLDTYSKSETNSYVGTAINDLYAPTVGGSTRYIYQISQTDGIIYANSYSPDTTPTTGSTKLVQSNGVKTYVDNAKTAANNYTDTAVADKITITNILGSGTRIEATSASPLSFDDAPFTSVGRFNWLSGSTQYITNCPAYIGGSAKGGLLETSFIQGGSTVLQTVYPSAGADSPSIFWQRFRYGAGTTANPYRWTNWFAFTGTEVIPANAQTTNLTSGMRSVAQSTEENDFDQIEEPIEEPIEEER